MGESTRRIIVSEKVSAAIGPYSIAVTTGELIFVSGTLGMHPISGELIPGGIEEETRQALRNLSTVLTEGGSSLDQVVKTTVFMQDLREFKMMNEIYGEFFKDEPPARSTIQVAALPRGAAVEIEAIALVSG
ncbi:MAG: Rid family detoxifying hydrolase [Anaerolineales bacterium]